MKIEKIKYYLRTCRGWKTLLPEYILKDDRLNPEEEKNLEAHIKKCSNCRKEMERLKLTIETIKPSSDFADKIISGIKTNPALSQQQKTVLPGIPGNQLKWASGAAIALIALFILFFNKHSQPIYEKDFYKVVELKGHVTLTDQNYKNRNLSLKDTIAGGKISLGQGAKLTFVSREVLFQLKENSSIEIKKLYKKEKSIFLKKGTIYVRIRKKGLKHLRIETKNGSAEAIGTSFIVNAKKDQTKIAVLSGEVKIENQKDKKIIKKNQFALLQNNKTELLDKEQEIGSIKWVEEDLKEKYDIPNRFLKVNNNYPKKAEKASSLIKKYSNMLKRDPYDFKATYCLSVLYFGIMRPDLGAAELRKKDIEEVKEITNREKAICYWLLLIDQYFRHDNKKAIKYAAKLEKYIDYIPDDENPKRQTLSLLFNTYIKIKNANKAEKILTLLEPLGKNSRFYLKKAMLEILKDNLYKAKDYLKNYALNENIPDHRLGLDRIYATAKLGEIAYMEGDLENAQMYLEQAIKTQNKWRTFSKLIKERILLADIYEEQGEYEKSLDTLEKAFKITDSLFNKFGYYKKERDEIKAKLQY
jgi:hypothetical protein